MLNIAAFMGRLTADPELRHTPNNVPVTTFTVAVNRSYVKPGAERQSDFIDVVAWRGSAEFVCRYFKKGQMIAVNGTIQTRTYTDKEGRNRKVVEIIADNVHFAESRGAGTGGTSDNRSSEQTSDDFESSDVAFAAGDADDFTEIDDDDDLPF